MKKIVFLAHDPGGYDVIWPVYNYIKELHNDIELILTGPMGEKNKKYKKEAGEVMQYFARLIEHFNFLLVTGTSWNSYIELAAIKLCRENSIETISILDYWCNYKERFRMKNEYIFPNHYFIMDEIAYKEAVESGVDSSIMVIVGHPGLDFYIDRKVKIDKNNKILFLSQPLSALYKDDEGYSEFSAFEGILKAGKELNIDVKIKFHPKETEKMKCKYRYYQAEGNLSEIACGYNVVIGMSTMGLLQCALMGIPVVSYQPGMVTEDVCIVNKLGITKGAYTYEELLNQLRNIKAVKKEKLPFWFDGKSTERCVKKILRYSED